MSAPRKVYSRGQYFGFHVKVPLELQSPNNQNLIPFLNASLTRTQDYWCASVRQIHFIPMGTTTAVLLHSTKQRYMTKWREISTTMFSDWSKTLGEEAVCEPGEEESRRIIAMFKEFMRGNNPAVHPFWRQTNHSVEIKQPSPLAGMVADALKKSEVANPFNSNPYDLTGVGGALPATAASALIRSLPRLPLPTFTSSLDQQQSYSQVLSPKGQKPAEPSYSQVLTPKGQKPAEPSYYSQVLTPKGQKTEASAAPPAPRKRQAEAQLPPRPIENPFRLKPNHADEIKHFLLSARPWNEPSKYREITPSDDPTVYWHDKRVYENKMPAIATALTHLIPPIARRSACQGHLLTIDLPHTDTLAKIYKLLYRKGWNWDGIYTLLQWPNMQFQTYGFKTSKPHHPSLNPIEAHRRILKIEGAIAEMADYLAAAVTAGKKSLRNIAWRDLADAVIVLAAHNPDAADIIIAILPHEYKQSCSLSVQLDWLEANRAESLKHHTPFLTELGWGLGLLALIYSFKASMASLDSPEEAESVLTSLMAFIDRRAYVFTKDVEPALLYGARLTQYATAVRDLCEKFNGLGQVPLTTAGKFHELDVKGRLVGSDGSIIPLGLDNIPKNTARILPFSDECASLTPDPDLEAICADLVASEGRLISAMLADLGIDPGCPAVAQAVAGQAKINDLLATDSHSLNKTSVLPPSASLPGAWFEPGVVFGV